MGAGAVLLASCGGPAEMSVLEATEASADGAADDMADGAADDMADGSADEVADAGAGGEQDGDATEDGSEAPVGVDDPEPLDPEGATGSFDANEVEAAVDAAEAAVPDPDLVAAPCHAHEGRELDAFMDLVAPVDEQVAGDEVEIVGCSNVYEATVNWRLLDADGGTLDEGFTTATCGNGCVGDFRETVSLAAAAGAPVVRLQAFWVSPQDGAEEDLQERTIVLE